MVNKVMLLGRLGKDPEVRHLDGGNVVANFPIATDESYKDRNGEKKERTEWHRIVVWRKQAEIAEKYLNKGDMIHVEGKIRTRSFEDKEGNTKYITEVESDRFTMLGGKSGGGSGQNYSQTQSQQQGANVQEGQSAQDVASSGPDDDLPF